MYESGRDTASTTGSNYEILPAAASVSFEDTILIKMQNFWCVYIQQDWVQNIQNCFLNRS